MNKIILTGYIASDIDLRYTQQGTPVCTFDLAVRRPKTKTKTTDYFTIVCWRSTATFVADYFSNGSGIEVSGMLTIRKWVDKDGKNRYSTEIIAEEVDFGKRPKDDARHETQPELEPEYEEHPDNGDCPF